MNVIVMLESCTASENVYYGFKNAHLISCSLLM